MSSLTTSLKLECSHNMHRDRAGFKTVGAPGQDIFRGDVSCQTYFFRGVVGAGGEGGGGGGGGGCSEAPFGGGPFRWGPLGMCPVFPAINPALHRGGFRQALGHFGRKTCAKIRSRIDMQALAVELTGSYIVYRDESNALL